jgi:hypothetical protein
MGLAKARTSVFPSPGQPEAEEPQDARDSGVSLLLAPEAAGLGQNEGATTGRLATTVANLRVLEDEMLGMLADAERALHSLNAGGIHQDAGFRSFAEFEERVSGATPLLLAMRSSACAAKHVKSSRSRRKRPPSARAVSGSARDRRTKALAEITRTLTHLRDIDGQLRGKAEKARGLLRGIEQGRFYEECGYVSFEEFLERGLGPSPVLASSMATTSSHGDVDLAEFAPADPVPSGVDRVPALFDLPPSEPVADVRANSPEEPTPKAPEVAPVPAPSRRSALVVSIVMAAAASLLGAAVGIRTSHDHVAPPPPQTSVAAPTSPSAPLPVGSTSTKRVDVPQAPRADVRKQKG